MAQCRDLLWLPIEEYPRARAKNSHLLKGEGANLSRLLQSMQCHWPMLQVDIDGFLHHDQLLDL
jgi:hypothetical protein